METARWASFHLTRSPESNQDLTQFFHASYVGSVVFEAATLCGREYNDGQFSSEDRAEPDTPVR